MASKSNHSSLRYCSALLIVSLLLVVAVAEAVSKPRQSIEAHLLGTVSAASKDKGEKDEYYDSGYGHEVAVQLAETQQANCRAYGCAATCISGYSWTSRFTCVQHDQYGYGYKSYGKLGHHTFTQVMGECTWDFMPYTESVAGTCPWVLVNGQTYRVGKASGRCTFPGGDQCGEPLCSTLRVNIDGDVYVTAAYTTSSTGTVTAVQDADCQALMDWGGAPGVFPASCAAILPLNRVAAPRTGNKTAGQTFSFDVSTANYGYGYGGHDDTTYYPANAVVISGSITSSNGQKHGCYNEGTIEYVPYVFVDPAAVAVPCPPGAVVVNPQEFTVGFTQNSCSYS